jgi:hypothetical protein
MIWVLVWTVLVLGAAAALFLLGRRLWRLTKALTRELGVVTDRLSEVADRLADLQASPERPQPRSDDVGSAGQLRRPLR